MKRPHTVEPWLPLLLPIVARLHELLITGHGLDISIPLHSANHPLAFLAGITLLGYLRTRLTRHEHKFHVYIDLATLLFLIHSWWEKRQPDTERSGYASCRIALVLWVIGFLYAAYGVLAKRRDKLLVTLKVCIGIMIVTGPPAAASLILFCVQVWVLQQLKKQEVAPSVQAFLWRLVIRHAFFATNHACAFNRLHLSAAFIATIEFNFLMGGFSLFLNTFGWEFLGLLLVPEWRWYSFYQGLETAISCISVSVMRRHLMVWAVFAPRFLFAAIFLVLNCFGQLVSLVGTK